jgi:diadenosine tetraphosphate (Ap4A) HIT family hydrolase
MSEPGCPFCFPPAERLFHIGKLALGLWDGYPVSDGHALLVPKRHVATWFDATLEEQAELNAAISIARAIILEKYRPDGLNIGINVGEAAGQTIFHLHVHVIPRYHGDVPNPRGGVRHVIPHKGDYPTASAEGGNVAEAASMFDGRHKVGDAAVPTHEAAGGVAAFGERILQLLDESRRVATYKYAVLLALTDLCLEQAPAAGGPSGALTTRQVAEKVLDLYWPHTSPFQGKSDWQGVLKQNTGGQAEILSAIRKFRERFAVDPSEPLSRARHQAPEKYEALLRTVEWKLIHMPLPRVQLVGNTESRFLYDIAWDTSVKRRDMEDPGFDGQIHLRPGVAAHLTQLSGLIRPLIQRGWAAMVAALNPAATDEARLQEFLFGVPRISLDPVRADLRELQDNRCFYCDEGISGQADVDHFVPWARYPDNGIENLVVAHQRCNGDKRDFLAAGEHVQRWSQRFAVSDARIASQLEEIARRATWDQHPDRTMNVARALYLALPGDVKLWLRKREFVSVEAERVLLRSALRSESPPPSQP